MSYDAMASQLAKLLAQSDLAELEEVVRRWLAESPEGEGREQMEKLGAQLLTVKRALVASGQRPSEAQLEGALRTMFSLASGPGAGAEVPPGREGLRGPRGGL